MDPGKVCSRCRFRKDLFDFSKTKARVSGYQNYCKECKSSLEKERRGSNLEKANAYSRADANKRYAEDPTKYLIRNKKWVENNPEKRISIKARRRARKLCAVPKWADRAAIQRIYTEARKLTLLTVIKHHVDHIVPLVSSIVCGLHWELNLQALPATENLRKHNSVWPDMP